MREKDGGWWVAAEALGKIGGAEAVPALVEGLESPDDDIRQVAIRQLGELGPISKPAVAALAKLQREDPQKRNRSAAAATLAKITGMPVQPK